MASHQSLNKKFWAKDMGKRGVEFHDLGKWPREVVATFPKTEDKDILKKLDELEKR